MTGEQLPALPAPAMVMEAGGYPAEQHPVLAYLGRLNTPISRESMLRRLNIVARMLSEGTLEALHFPWHQRLTYVVMLAKPRQNIVYVSAERSRPCWTNVTHRIYTCWLSRFEGPLLCTMWLWGLVKLMFPKQGRVHSAPE